jgi:hypothetical protein
MTISHHGYISMIENNFFNKAIRYLPSTFLTIKVKDKKPNPIYFESIIVLLITIEIKYPIYRFIVK